MHLFLNDKEWEIKYGFIFLLAIFLLLVAKGRSTPRSISEMRELVSSLRALSATMHVNSSMSIINACVFFTPSALFFYFRNIKMDGLEGNVRVFRRHHFVSPRSILGLIYLADVAITHIVCDVVFHVLPCESSC